MEPRYLTIICVSHISPKSSDALDIYNWQPREQQMTGQGRRESASTRFMSLSCVHDVPMDAHHVKVGTTDGIEDWQDRYYVNEPTDE
eukprot:scaffold473745_cov19-Prasinocladus_malaysianus.AAC.1